MKMIMIMNNDYKGIKVTEVQYCKKKQILKK